MACGDLNFLEGGTIKDTTVVGSTIVSPTVNEGVFKGIEISNLAAIDTNSTQRIADAMGNLTSLSNTLTALIARCLNDYGLVDTAFLQTVMKALKLLPAVPPSVAQKILDALQLLPPLKIAEAVSSWSSEVVATSLSACLHQLTDDGKVSHVAGLMNTGVAQVIFQAIADLPPSVKCTITTDFLTDCISKAIVQAISDLPISQLTNLAKALIGAIAQLPEDTLAPFAEAIYQVTLRRCVPKAGGTCSCSCSGSGTTPQSSTGGCTCKTDGIDAGEL